MVSSFWTRVQAMQGQTLKTRSQSKPFDVLDVSHDRIVFVPQDGKKGQRWISRKWLEQIANLDLDESELYPIRLRQEFPNDQNLSYMAAIVYAAQTKTKE